MHRTQWRSSAQAGHPVTEPLQSIPRDQRLEVILDRIVFLLESEGASESDWTLTQFARAANTSRVTIYEYFGDLHGLRAAVQRKMVGNVKPLHRMLDDVPREERPHVAISVWMKWVDENHRLATRALWLEDSSPAFIAFVSKTAQAFIRHLADVFLGVTEPSRELLRQIEVYLRAAEACLRMWLVEGRIRREEVERTVSRLTQDVVRMGEARSDVPKPLPGRAATAA